MERIKGSILPGGLLKIETDRISAPNHLSADRLIRGLEAIVGGATTVEHKKEGMLHHHDHGHDHTQEGQ